MSYENPTPLRIGMVGLFSGKRYRVAGRVVLGMEEDGATYYWNEFNLVNMEGESATLVCERGEHGLEWRLFTCFEPRQPMTAAEAATKRVRDQVHIDGVPARVTLVDQSRVYHIEGQAPEGVEVGDVADYFNAQTGDDMVVVSWTGNEVEYFRGQDLSVATVMSAFNLSAPKAQSRYAAFQQDSPAKFSVTKVVTILVVVGLIGLVSFLILRNHKTSPQKVTKAKEPVPALVLGSKGTLDRKEYRVAGHAVVEIAEVSRRFERHEYHLTTEGQGRHTLLIYQLTPDFREWFVFSPVEPAEPMAPEHAATLPGGAQIELQGQKARITDLFQSSVRKAEPAAGVDFKPGALQFGFVARSSSNLFLARWTASEVMFYAGKPLSSKALTEAFKSKQP